MRKPTVAVLLLLALAAIAGGCGRRQVADPDARVKAEITRYGMPETIARAREQVAAKPSAETYDHLARALLAGKQPRPSREALQKAVSLDPAYPPSAVMLARALMQDGKMAPAEQMMRTVLAKHPREAAAQDVLARVLLSQGRASEALTGLQEALKQNPKSAELVWARADAQAVLKDYERACQDYQAAIALQPKTIGLRASYVETLMGMGKRAEAGKAALEAVALAPNSAEVRFLAGTTLHQAGQLDEALVQYKEALVIDPAMVLAANNLALLLADRRQETGTAVAWARKAAKLQPRSLDIADTLGWALARDGRYQEGLRLLQQVNRRWPGQPPIWYHLGWTLVKAGQKAEGVKWLRQAAGSRSEIAAEARKALAEAG